MVCPGLINTNILEAERNRGDFGSKTNLSALRPDAQEFAVGFAAALKAGYEPSVVAEHVLDGIRSDRFYILPAQPEILERVDERMMGIVNRQNPTPR